MEGYGNENPGAFQPTRPLRGATEAPSLHSWEDVFQPTRPLRGATSSARSTATRARNFNPRAPCGARLPRRSQYPPKPHISTHAPLAGHDAEGGVNTQGETTFQPTRPLRGTTRESFVSDWVLSYFNPRAPCGARQVGQGGILSPSPYFNPRAPCGARPNS